MNENKKIKYINLVFDFRQNVNTALLNNYYTTTEN